MDVIMQKLMQMEEKINYLIALHHNQMAPQVTTQQPQIQPLQPQIQKEYNSPFQVAPPSPGYQQVVQPPKMPEYQFQERMFPSGIEPQRFGTLTRGGGKQS